MRAWLVGEDGVAVGEAALEDGVAPPAWYELGERRFRWEGAREDGAAVYVEVVGTGHAHSLAVAVDAFGEPVGVGCETCGRRWQVKRVDGLEH